MKIPFGILVAGVVALTGCNNHNPEKGSSGSVEQVDPKREFSRLHEFLKKFEEPAQTFKVPADKLIEVTGRQGTVIHINPIDLETDSREPIGNEIDIELKELSNQQQLLRANA